MRLYLEAVIKDGAKPSLDDEHGVPRCSEDGCPKYDGKRCELLGRRPDNICEPAVIDIVAHLKEKVS